MARAELERRFAQARMTRAEDPPLLARAPAQMRKAAKTLKLLAVCLLR